MKTRRFSGGSAASLFSGSSVDVSSGSSSGSDITLNYINVFTVCVHIHLSQRTRKYVPVISVFSGPCPGLWASSCHIRVMSSRQHPTSLNIVPVTHYGSQAGTLLTWQQCRNFTRLCKTLFDISFLKTSPALKWTMFKQNKPNSAPQCPTFTLTDRHALLGTKWNLLTISKWKWEKHLQQVFCVISDNMIITVIISCHVSYWFYSIFSVRHLHETVPLSGIRCFYRILRH